MATTVGPCWIYWLVNFILLNILIPCGMLDVKKNTIHLIMSLEIDWFSQQERTFIVCQQHPPLIVNQTVISRTSCQLYYCLSNSHPSQADKLFYNNLASFDAETGSHDSHTWAILMWSLFFSFDSEWIKQKLYLIHGVMTCNLFRSHVMQYGVCKK